jgi:hypothetical protein
MDFRHARFRMPPAPLRASGAVLGAFWFPRRKPQTLAFFLRCRCHDECACVVPGGCVLSACPAGGNQREQAREKNQKKLQELAKGKQKESASSLAKRREAYVALPYTALSCVDADGSRSLQGRRGAARETSKGGLPAVCATCAVHACSRVAAESGGGRKRCTSGWREMTQGLVLPATATACGVSRRVCIHPPFNGHRLSRHHHLSSVLSTPRCVRDALADLAGNTLCSRISHRCLKLASPSPSRRSRPVSSPCSPRRDEALSTPDVIAPPDDGSSSCRLFDALPISMLLS